MAKILSVSVFVFYIFIQGVHAQDDVFSFNRGNTEQTNYYIEIPYQNINRKIVIEVILNGKTRKFLVDTGAPLTITENLFKEMKLPVLRNESLKDANGIEDSAKVVSLSGLNIGGVIFNAVPAIVKNTDFFSCWGIDGVIGSNLLRNSIIQFDSNEKTIILADYFPENVFLGKGVSTEMKLDSINSTPIIPIFLFNEEKGYSVYHEVLFDTGDEALYAVSIDNYNFFEENVPGLFTKYAESEGTHTISINTAINQQHYLLGIPEVLINGVSIKNVIAKTSHSSNSRIGVSILDAGTVMLDYIDKKFYLYPVVNMPQKYPTIEPVFKEGKFVIGIIWDKSLKDKINTGDEIIKIGDINYNLYDLCDFYNDKIPFVDRTDFVTVVFKDVDTGKQKSIKLLLDNDIQ
ncbi:MAG: retroviral-like aspartic protease family protein [Prevotellaceae bacterium]|jgi:predicted aspartyl protease|nr:retroviral-like aspartic protease family protein [Prevotellaceae bacterium]